MHEAVNEHEGCSRCGDHNWFIPVRARREVKLNQEGEITETKELEEIDITGWPQCGTCGQVVRTKIKRVI